MLTTVAHYKYGPLISHQDTKTGCFTRAVVSMASTLRSCRSSIAFSDLKQKCLQSKCSLAAAKPKFGSTYPPKGSRSYFIRGLWRPSLVTCSCLKGKVAKEREDRVRKLSQRFSRLKFFLVFLLIREITTTMSVRCVLLLRLRGGAKKTLQKCLKTL